MVSAEEAGDAGRVESAVAVELGSLCAATDRPGAARQLVAILGMLTKQTYRRGKMALIKPMTQET